MKVEVRAWVGNGEHRVDFSGEVDMVDPDMEISRISFCIKSGPQVVICYFSRHNPELDFTVMQVTSKHTSLWIRKGEHHDKGNRPVYGYQGKWKNGPIWELVRHE